MGVCRRHSPLKVMGTPLYMSLLLCESLCECRRRCCLAIMRQKVNDKILKLVVKKIGARSSSFSVGLPYQVDTASMAVLALVSDFWSMWEK